MTFYCVRCKGRSEVMVLGDWFPSWALCPACASVVEPAEVLADE